MERELDKEELEHLIVELLREQPLCVIATCFGNVPRASTVEYFPMATTIYILTEGGIKVDNILRNPNVSVAIHAPFCGWKTVRGVQITGTAEVAGKGSRVFEEGLDAFNMRRGKVGTVPGFMSVIRVMPSRIEYLDTALEDKGFKVRQIFLC